MTKLDDAIHSFGEFMVREPWKPHDKEYGWEVYLPHQCDGWTIVDDWENGHQTTREEAAEGLAGFLAEGMEALAYLRGETP